MLETIDLKKKIDKETYNKHFQELALKLREMQQHIKERNIPIIIVFEGWDAAGKGTQIKHLADIFDPRKFQVFPASPPNPDELRHPFLWRYWNKIPENKWIAVFDRSWYGRVLVERVDKLIEKEQWSKAYRSINQFERQLSDENYVIIKLFLHISKKEQKKRFKSLEESKYDKWKVTKEDWKHHKQYDEYVEATEEMLAKTNTHIAPWTIIESTNKRYATLKIMQTILETVDYKLRKIEGKTQASISPDRIIHEPIDFGGKTILDKVDLSKKIEDVEEYNEKLNKYQLKMRDYEFEIYQHQVPVAILYEGWDAGGKGGNIRRVAGKLDPRGYSVVPVAAPRGEENTHHYLWRFWKQVPRTGHITIFDRTWYGRVLVERIEGFCSEEQWRRAFQEINEFEEQLTDFGTVLVKFWIHIDKEEQLKRFKAREENPFKRHKITDEDWRNREKWDEYEEAVIDMLQKTSTTYAPWTIISGNCKWYARIQALETVCDAIGKALDKQKKKK